jgi:hypothetical protein
LAALLPDSDGRQDVLFDFSDVGSYHNGTIDAAKARSHAKFAADFGVPCTRENVETAVRTCVANAHAFKPVA